MPREETDSSKKMLQARSGGCDPEVLVKVWVEHFLSLLGDCMSMEEEGGVPGITVSLE